MACFGCLLTVNTVAQRVVKPNQIIKSLIKPCSTLYSTCYYPATMRKILNMKMRRATAPYGSFNVFISTLDKQFNAYHAQPIDSYYEGDYAETKKSTFIGETGKKAISETLKKELHCTQDDADSMMKICKQLPRYKIFVVSERIKYFCQNGITETSIIVNPWLLTIDMQKTSSRLKCIQKIGMEINEVVYLFKLSSKLLCKLSQTVKDDFNGHSGGNRLQLFSRLLECNMSEVCKILAKHPFLCAIPYPRIEIIMNLLLAHNISRENILKDMWVFRYNPVMIEYRLQRASSIGYENIRPWLIHCSEAAYERSLERKIQANDTLGPNRSVQQYLADRLDCSCENIASLYRSYPLLSTVHVNKLKETLDFLFAENFTPLHIKLVPRILCHSLDTIKERLIELRELGYPLSSLYPLCRSKRQYAETIAKLKIRRGRNIDCARA